MADRHARRDDPDTSQGMDESDIERGCWRVLGAFEDGRLYTAREAYIEVGMEGIDQDLGTHQRISDLDGVGLIEVVDKVMGRKKRMVQRYRITSDGFDILRSGRWPGLGVLRKDKQRAARAAADVVSLEVGSLFGKPKGIIPLEGDE